MPADANPPSPSTDPAYADRMRQELERIGLRRGGPIGTAGPVIGLSLSGGGIRSATFCLGVLQALSRAPAPPGAQALLSADAARDGKPFEDSLLGQVDYLSTVSGGGYIGTFFASLFVPERLTPGAGVAASAAAAYATLRQEAGRLRPRLMPQADGPKNAMAWLRENGRYLAPSSAGDLLYFAATVVRAWVGLQLVVGLLLLVVLALLNLVKNAALDLAQGSDWTGFVATLARPDAWIPGVWLSGLWMFPVVVLAFWALPCGVAYWLTYPPARPAADAAPDDGINAPARQSVVYWTGYLGCALVLALAIAAGLRHGAPPPARWNAAATPFAVVLVGMLSGAAWFLAFGGKALTFAALRVRLTRQLTAALKAGGALAFLALVDTLAQSLYVQAQTLAKPLGAAAVLTWLVRRLAPHLKSLQDTKKRRVPLDLVLTIGAAAMTVLVVTVWDYGVIWLQLQRVSPHCDVRCVAQAAHDPVWLWVLLVGAGTLSLLIGHYPQFLNLSSLQGIYSARLTRAYQGASNAMRFGPDSKARSSAEALASDHLTHAQYNANPYAPLHIINICLNQNVDPAEQLVQRDRKGRPLAILPGLPHRGIAGGPDPLPFAIDGEYHTGAAGSEDTLTMGEWVGVSGAAAATGSGRRTSASMALLLGLANVRLGRWWCSGFQAPQPAPGTTPPKKGLDSLFRTVLPTQAYLTDELGAHFYGTRRPRHYLSDGGHFEDLGIYELLRAERNVKLIIACDCGADPDYQFDDLANLIRLARIDFNIDIEVDEDVTTNIARLGAFLGTAAQLAPAPDGKPAAHDRCALLLKVFRGRGARSPVTLPDMHIVLIKPAPIASAPLDIVNYRAGNPAFPQQSTGDQFFDEAQWESYRKLGFEIGKNIFSADDLDTYKLLWETLLKTTNLPPA